MLDPVYGVELRGRMVSSHGRIISARGVVSRGYRTKVGYYETQVSANNQRRTVLVHRLVAYTFLGPPSESHRCSVNYKDLDKSNNAVHNLEWVSPAKNRAHFLAESSTFKKGRSDMKPVWSWRSGETGRWTWHASMTSAQCALGINRGAISECVAGRLQNAGGYEFQAAERKRNSSWLEKFGVILRYPPFCKTGKLEAVTLLGAGPMYIYIDI